MVPLLLIEGRPVYEAAALGLLLAERHPEARLAPPVGDPLREPYLQWMLHLTNTVQPAFRRWFYAEDVAGSDNAATVREIARQELESAFERLNEHLTLRGPFICGDFGPTAADFHAVMLARWSRNLPKSALEWPAVAELVRRLVARESFTVLSAAEDLSGWP
jgi:glutathione S-transferase